MNWLNIEIRLMRSPEYIGSEPVERATWLNLMAYCAEQENGGRITGCGTWKDRQWQQTCGVTAQEVAGICSLWTWEGSDLVVWNYPTDKEAEVRAKREGGARGGKSKASKHPAKHNPSSATSSATSSASTERKGKERKGMEAEEEEPPPPQLDFEKSPPEKHNPNRMATFEEVMKFAKSQPMPITDDCCEAFFDRMEAEGWVTPRGLPLADWRARFRTWATNWTNNANAKNNR